MNQNRIKYLLLFSLALETICVSYGLLFQVPAYTVSILYPLAGLSIVFLSLKMPTAQLRSGTSYNYGLILKSVLILLMAVLASVISRFWMDQIDIDPDYADMLPIIKTMNERFLHGQWNHVYDPISEIGNGTLPIYLPAMWMPFSIATAANIDLRWVTVFAILLSFSLILLSIQTKKNGWFAILQILLVSLLFWWLFSADDCHGLISMSEEGVVIFYIVLLTFAVISGNMFFISICTSLCLLSRYSMIGWIIPFLIWLLNKKQYRNTMYFIIILVFSFLGMLLIPFGFKIVNQMIFLPIQYVDFAKIVWNQTPEVFWLNPGLAKFFGRNHILLLHKTLIVSTFILPLLFMLFCISRKKWRPNNVNLACLKLSILVFYQFIDVPYGYLFFESSFVSFVIVAVLLRTNKQIIVER